MESKWIFDLYEVTYGMSGEMWKEMLPILNKIDKLLRLSALETDNETLHDDIMKEIEDVG